MGTRYPLSKDFQPTDQTVEISFESSGVLRIEEAEAPGETGEITRLACRTAGNSKEMGVILVCRSGRPFHNVAGNGYTGPPQLRLQSVSLFNGKRTRVAIHIDDKRVSKLKDR